MTLNCIVAFCKNNNGIGFENKLPWYISEDLKYFKEKTNNHVVVMGKNTYDSLPDTYKPLPNRVNIVITNKCIPNVTTTTIDNLDNTLQSYSTQNIFIIGGANIYNQLYGRFESIYVTYIDKHFDCDSFFPKIGNEYSLTTYSSNKWSEQENCYYRFLEYKLSKSSSFDDIYLNLANKVMEQQQFRYDRTGTGTYSIFGEQIQFDIENCVPLLTTKRVAWKSCIEELLWFLRGDTNSNILKNKNVNIWNDNSTRAFLDKAGLYHLKEGDCGANYSFQWRYFGQTYINSETSYKKNTKYDQINNVMNLLRSNPTSRRIFMSAWNPVDLDKTVLPPCHVSVQFYVDNANGLHCHMYQRSCDVFLGLPFNIFSYTVLTYILAKKCNYVPKKLIISFGDVHIYKNHVEQLKVQSERSRLSYPLLKLSDNIFTKEFDEMTIDDFELIGYFPHPSIKGKMSV